MVNEGPYVVEKTTVESIELPMYVFSNTKVNSLYPVMKRDSEPFSLTLKLSIGQVIYGDYSKDAQGQPDKSRSSFKPMYMVITPDENKAMSNPVILSNIDMGYFNYYYNSFSYQLAVNARTPQVPQPYNNMPYALIGYGVLEDGTVIQLPTTIYYDKVNLAFVRYYGIPAMNATENNRVIAIVLVINPLPISFAQNLRYVGNNWPEPNETQWMYYKPLTINIMGEQVPSEAKLNGDISANLTTGTLIGVDYPEEEPESD